MFKNSNLKFIIIPVLIFTVVLFVTDVYLLHQSKKNSFFNEDEKLGWVMKKNFKKEYINFSLNNKEYKTIMESTSERGFSFYEKPNQNKKKILVLGDSFVVNQYHGNESAFWNILREKINKKYDYQFYVAGAPGYSSVQQLVLLKEIIKDIEPDIFILGFCTFNDFFENNSNLGNLGIIRYQTNFRPYYDIENDNIGKLNHYGNKIYRFLFNSYFFRKIDNIFMRVQQRFYKDFYYNIDENLLNESINVSEIIISKMRNLVGKDKLFISLDCAVKPNKYHKIWKKIILDLEGYPIDQIGMEIYELSKTNKELIHSDDFHLSAEGQKLYGIKLFNYLDENFFKKVKSN